MPLGVWLAGALAALGALVTALLRVSRVARDAEVLDDPVWCASASELAGRFGMRRPVRVLASPAVHTPMAGGLLRPTVFVPTTAREWPAELRGMVLAHEIAHLAGRDPLRKVLGRAALVLYWFHPLAWLAARQASADCEQACDEAVLGLGVLPSAYAGVLLHFVDAAPPVLAGAALPIVRRSSLEARLMAILDPARRPAARRRIVLPTTAAAAITLSLAAAQPAASSSAPVAATVRPAPAPVAVLRPIPALPTAKPAAAPVASPFASCWTDSPEGAFRGTVRMDDSGGEMVIHERLGRAGSRTVLQRSFGDLRVCAWAEGVQDDAAPPSTWASRGERVVLATEQNGELRQMEIADGRTTWTVNGAAREVDAAARAWQTRLVTLLDATWEHSRLRGEESSLRGEISSILGERSSLQGEISSVRGEASSLRGEISSIRGEESSLNGKISSIRGHLSSLQGQISSEQGAISSLNASGRSGDEARIRQHQAAIQALQEEVRRYDVDGRVRAVERELAELDVARRTAAIERQIADLDVESRIATVNGRIAGLRVEENVAGIERRITDLDADRRGRVLEARVREALGPLRAELRNR